MKLRSGLSYESKLVYVKRINNNLLKFKKSIKKLLKSSCLICMDSYHKGDKITSCSNKNLYKHNFHSTCLQEHIKSSAEMTGNAMGPFHCPYCMTKLNKFDIAVRKM